MIATKIYPIKKKDASIVYENNVGGGTGGSAEVDLTNIKSTNIQTNTLKANIIEATTITASRLQVFESVNFDTLKVTNINVAELTADKATMSDAVINNLEVNNALFDHASISDLDADNIKSTYADITSLSVGDYYDKDGRIDLNGTMGVDGSIYVSDTVETQNLNVTGAAHFYQLMIDRIKATSGSQIYGCAQGFEAAQVAFGGLQDTGDFRFFDWSGWDAAKHEAGTLYCRLGWHMKRQDGTNINNDIEPGDFVCCSENSGAQASEFQHRFYWGEVVHVSRETWDDGGMHYIFLKTKDCVGDISQAQVGDNIAQLGSRNIDRSSAIYISASSSNLDSNLQPPFLAFYQGITSYSQSGIGAYRKTFMDRTRNEFVGNFKATNGQTLEQYVDSLVPKDNVQIYTYYAYNTRPSDTGLSFTNSDSMTYVGVIVTTSATRPNSGYNWQKKQEETSFYSFVPYNCYYRADFSTSKIWVLRANVQLYLTDSKGTHILYKLPSDMKVGLIDSATSKITYYTPNENTGVVSVGLTGSLLNENGSVASIPQYYRLRLTKQDPNYTEPLIYGEIDIPLQINSTALLQLTNRIEARVEGLTTDVSGMSATVAQLVIDKDNITSTVGQLSDDLSTLSNTYTQIEQTVNSITLSVQTANNAATQANNSLSTLNQQLLACGINLTDNTITLTTNNFALQTQSGEKVLGSDESGNLFIDGNVNTKMSYLKTFDLTEYGDPYVIRNGQLVWSNEVKEIDTCFLHVKQDQYPWYFVLPHIADNSAVELHVYIPSGGRY